MRSYHHGDLRQAILVAARPMLERGADRDLSLRALAQAVGVSPNAPYRHFANKEALLAAISEQGFSELTARFTICEGMAVLPRLAGCVEGYLGFARENPGLYRLMFNRRLEFLVSRAEACPQAGACFAAISAVSARLLDRSEDDPETRAGAGLIWSISHGAALLEIDDAITFLKDSERPSAARVTQLIVKGLNP